MEIELKSFEIVTLAVFLLGGESKFVDTEDIAVKANALAPGLFSWRKYKDQISFDHVRRQLEDARVERNGEYLIGSVKKGWQLTRKGLIFATDRINSVATASMKTSRLGNKEQMRLRLEKERIRASDAFLKFETGEGESITKQQAFAFFRIDEYVPSHVRESKILRIVNNFSEDAELGAVVCEMEKIVRKG